MVPVFHYHRGIRFPLNKEPAASRGIETLKTIEKVYIPLSYGENRICQPSAGVYETVMRGDVIGMPESPDDCPAIATVSGVFTNTQPLHHPLFGELNCAVVQCMVAGSEGKDEKKGIEKLKPKDILDIARKASIIDELDGIPLHVKLLAWQENGCQLIVANGVEGEPYASSAWAVLNEAAEQVLAGLQLAARVAGAPHCHVAVRLPANRRRPLAQRLGENRLFQVSGRYPAVRYSRRPETPGFIGVQACLALSRAVQYGEAHCDCVVTVAGDAVSNPRNIRAPFGTPINDIFTACGLGADPSYVLLGDMMTGISAQSLDIPLLPGMTCLLALTKRQVVTPKPCIGCGRCAQVCHAGLLPYEIVRRLENMHYERLPALHPEECDGCGACSYVCPAGREVTARVAEANQTHGTIFLNWGDDDDA